MTLKWLKFYKFQFKNTLDHNRCIFTTKLKLRGSFVIKGVVRNPRTLVCWSVDPPVMCFLFLMNILGILHKRFFKSSILGVTGCQSVKQGSLVQFLGSFFSISWNWAGWIKNCLSPIFKNIYSIFEKQHIKRKYLRPLRCRIQPGRQRPCQL